VQGAKSAVIIASATNQNRAAAAGRHDSSSPALNKRFPETVLHLLCKWAAAASLICRLFLLSCEIIYTCHIDFLEIAKETPELMD
jgi:hypothetical protein